MDAEAHSRYGFYVVALGIGALLLTVGAGLYKGEATSDITALVSSIGTIIGTMVGAYFGVAVGAAGKAKADQEKEKAEKQVKVLSGEMDPAVFLQVKNRNANLF